MGRERSDHREQDDDRADHRKRCAAGDGCDEQQQRGDQFDGADQDTRLLRLDGRQAVARRFLFVEASP